MGGEHGWVITKSRCERRSGAEGGRCVWAAGLYNTTLWLGCCRDCGLAGGLGLVQLVVAWRVSCGAGGAPGHQRGLAGGRAALLAFGSSRSPQPTAG